MLAVYRFENLFHLRSARALQQQQIAAGDESRQKGGRFGGGLEELRVVLRVSRLYRAAD
jgi:hypothetical protein